MTNEDAPISPIRTDSYGRPTKRYLNQSPAFLRKHQIRNNKIVRMYAQEPITMRALGLRFGLSHARIKAIIDKNADKFNWHLGHEKAKRINELRRLGEEATNFGQRIEVVREMREEFEGNKTTSVQVTNTVTNINAEIRGIDADGLRAIVAACRNRTLPA